MITFYLDLKPGSVVLESGKALLYIMDLRSCRSESTLILCNPHQFIKYSIIIVGTGSGALSTAIARTISPNGKLYTFEVNKDRAEAAVYVVFNRI